MVYTFAFVDSISETATIRLDLSASPWTVRAEGTSLGPPPRRRAVVSTMLVDGETIPAAVYGNRELTLSLYLNADGDTAATYLQLLSRELDRPFNFLRYKAGTTNNVYFRILPSEYNSVEWDPVHKYVTINLLAEPFAYGVKQTLSPVTVFNDPAAVSAPINPNPYFETDVTGWSGTGGTFVRSTVQHHEGVAAGLLTPDGVTATAIAQLSTHFTAVAGMEFRAQAWVRCASTRNVNVNIDWYTSADAYISSSTKTTNVTLNTFTLIEVYGVAPATTGKVGLSVTMTGTPPASDLLYVDEAWVGNIGSNSANGMYWDVTGVLGDVSTPLVLSFAYASPFGAGVLASAIGLRRRGTPTSFPFTIQAESMTGGTDTTIQTNDSVMSGVNSNYMRCTFGTTAMTNRLSYALHPLVASVDARGTYRVYLRHRQSVAGDVLKVILKWGQSDGTGVTYSGDTITLPSSASRRWTDLGLLSIPSGPDPIRDGYSGTEIAARGISVSLAAQRSSGTGNVDFDAMLLVPADDRFAVIIWPNESGPDNVVLDGTNSTAYLLEGTTEVRTGTAAVQWIGLLPAVSPGVTNRVYFLLNTGTTNQADDKTHSAAITASYFPRYLYVRPVST